MVNKRKKQ